jgi:hypothetical protein
MKEFVDLQGASGSQYRFRLWPEGAPHSPMAGNYVFVQEASEGFAVVLVGMTSDLSRARIEGRLAAKKGATHLYTRLNVARAVRAAEHEDIIAHYKPAAVVGDPA